MPGKAAGGDQPDPRDIPDTDEGDVEGHSMWINPTVSRELTASRTREIERQIRDQQRAREARSQDTKHR